MASNRYPGKPLIKIENLPMIEHVRRRTLMCEEFSDVVVATCDLEIQKTVEAFSGDVIMTSNDHIMASDRVAEAVEHLDCTHVINVQGDEILILPEVLVQFRLHGKQATEVNRSTKVLDYDLYPRLVYQSSHHRPSA